jgi:hypothetical protein
MRANQELGVVLTGTVHKLIQSNTALPHSPMSRQVAASRTCLTAGSNGRRFSLIWQHDIFILYYQFQRRLISHIYVI